jgi:hypothetical protein
MLLVGDSLAVGLSAPLKQLCSGSGLQFASMAKEGTTILAWSARDFPQADITLVSLGTNDMRLSDPLSERPKLDALLARLRSRSKRVVWLMPPPMPFPDRGVLKMILDATAAAGVEVMPSLEGISRAPDKIHCTPAGYAAWAGMIWRWIQ